MRVMVVRSFMFLGKKVPVGHVLNVTGNSEEWKKWGVPYDGPTSTQKKTKIELKDLKAKK